MPTLRSARALAAVALAAACGGQNSATSTASDDLTASRPEVSGSDHGVSNAVRDMPHTPPFLREQVEHRVMPVPHAARDLVDDPVVQAGVLPLVSTLSGLTFAGVGNGDYGFAPDAAPPDTNGAAGATQYVQWVNESFAVFDKTTGARLAGPTLGNQLFQVLGATHPCAQNNDGDPIAQYDKIANRWVLTQFSVTNGGSVGYYQCVAVSTTS
ncbi:MAG: hypothetical protein ACXWLM_02290, partial [Myxococcales bacterium]